MEFKNLSVLALFFLTLLGIHASKSGEEYWKSVWPNTPIPKTLLDLLLTDKGTSIPIKSQEEKQYWTIFFEHDLYPGKTMNLGIQKHSDIQSSKSTTHAPVKRASHTFKTLKGLGQTPEKETTRTNQPFGTFVWWYKKQTGSLTTRSDKATKIETTATNQPFGTFVWWNEKEFDRPTIRSDKLTKIETTRANQPFGTFVWWYKKEIERPTIRSDKTTKIETTTINQPFGTFVWWNKKETDRPTIRSDKVTKIETTRTNQPFGTTAWWHKKETEKETEIETENNLLEENQPFGLSEQGKKETEKSNQPFETQTSDEKEAHVLNNYCGTPSAIGEHKHCALSIESMMDFAISKLGKNIKVMSSSFSQSQDKYVVQEVNKIGDKAVMCHRLNFEEVVFYCHVVNATTTYMVPMMASDGTISKALTICHHDTRGMNPKVLNEVLNVKPGNVSVCHFIGNKAVAWVPNVSQSRGHPCVI
ncbi:unnamed protein product [Lathyrus oleraceus]